MHHRHRERLDRDVGQSCGENDFLSALLASSVSRLTIDPVRGLNKYLCRCGRLQRPGVCAVGGQAHRSSGCALKSSGSGPAGRVGEVRIGRRVPPKAHVLVEDEDTNGDCTAAAVTQRSDNGRIRPTGHSHVLPAAAVSVSVGGSERSVEEGLDHPGIAANRRAAVAVAPPSLVLDVEDRADRDNTDAERVASASAAVGEVLADHERLPNIERAVRCRTEGPRSASAARSARSCSMRVSVSSA